MAKRNNRAIRVTLVDDNDKGGCISRILFGFFQLYVVLAVLLLVLFIVIGTIANNAPTSKNGSSNTPAVVPSAPLPDAIPQMPTASTQERPDSIPNEKPTQPELSPSETRHLYKKLCQERIATLEASRNSINYSFNEAIKGKTSVEVEALRKEYLPSFGEVNREIVVRKRQLKLIETASERVFIDEIMNNSEYVLP